MRFKNWEVIVVLWSKLSHIPLEFLSVGVKLDTSKFTTLINIINEDYALEKVHGEGLKLVITSNLDFIY